jgi:chloramphenicol-sensitive protein RarD
VACGVGAHVIWGLFRRSGLLDPASPIEVLAHRIVWTLVLAAAVLALVGGWRGCGRWRRAVGWRTAAAVLIAANWGLFIYGVAIGHVRRSRWVRHTARW